MPESSLFEPVSSSAHSTLLCRRRLCAHASLHPCLQPDRRSCSSTAGLPPDFDMRECYKEEYAEVPATTQDYLNELPCRFNVEVALFSERPRIGGLTIVTSGAANRLFMLDEMCAAWVGPLAVAILLPVLDPAAERRNSTAGELGGSSPDAGSIAMEIRQLFTRAKADIAGCQMDIVFMTELVSDEVMLHTYPINAARNMAMLLARTELVFPMDIDFLPSKDFSDIVLDPERYAELRALALARHAIVPPAFRVTDEALAGDMAAGGRPAAVEAFADGMATSFSLGHNLTDFERWQNTTTSYEIQYRSGFEPWCILERLQAPWFDNRFRGRGLNKVNFFRVLNFTGFAFTVHRDAFIVHRPHTKVDLRYVSGSTRWELRKLWSRNTHWHHRSSLHLKNQTYTVPVTPAFKRCQAQLSWWNMYPPEGEPAQYPTVAVPFVNHTAEVQSASGAATVGSVAGEV